MPHAVLDAGYYYRRCSVCVCVCVCVCVSVLVTTVYPAKTDEPIQMPYRRYTHGARKKPCMYQMEARIS